MNVIDAIRKLPEKRDKRYSEFIQDIYERNKYFITLYLEGKLNALACHTKDKYRVCILENNNMIYFSSDAKNIPVPMGPWMDFWEEDHQKYFNVSEKMYKKMDEKERAKLECKLQIKMNYPKSEFFSYYASFYYPKEYDDWWWDNSIKFAEKQGMKGENYWRKRLKKT